MMSAAPLASGRAWVRMALPVSSAMMRASSSTRASTASAILCSRRPRSRGTRRLQRGKALCAAVTARSTSSARPRGTLAIGWRLPGASTTICSPEAASTQCPSISICTRFDGIGALLIATAMALSSSYRAVYSAFLRPFRRRLGSGATSSLPGAKRRARQTGPMRFATARPLWGSDLRLGSCTVDGKLRTRVGNGEPAMLFGAPLAPVVEDLLEKRVLARLFVEHALERPAQRLDDLRRQHRQLSSAGDHPVDRLGILGIVGSHHLVEGVPAGVTQGRLVSRGKRRPSRLVNEKLTEGLEFHDAWCVVVLGNLVEAQLLVIVGAHPFAGVDRSLLKGGIDVAPGDLLRHDAKLGHHAATEAGGAHLEAVEVRNRLELLAEPTEHLPARLAAGQTDHSEAVIDLIHQLATVAEQQPSRVLTRC